VINWSAKALALAKAPKAEALDSMLPLNWSAKALALAKAPKAEALDSMLPKKI
jgi:hypothetical protein